MKKSINAWSVERDVPFSEMFGLLKRCGFDAVELNVDAGGGPHALAPDVSDDALADIRRMAAGAGVAVSGISTSLYGGRLGLPEEDAIQFSAALIRTQLRAAAALGADGILVVPGADLSRWPLETVFRTVCEAFSRVRGDIDRAGKAVGLENVWNGYFTSPYDMVRLIDAIGHPLVGAYFDVGNVIAFSDPVRWIEVLGSRIVKIHVKGYRRAGGFNGGGDWCDLPEASVSWRAVTEALDKSGYGGFVTAEVSPTRTYDAHEDFLKEVARDMDALLAGELG
ncbi:MAG: sugar phosphate isomerase/epimerase [Oscillospiraceae bacterium]|nr:sugar phosphate isomerase/epimerase [Oscillospiraceae bacterium]